MLILYHNQSDLFLQREGNLWLMTTFCILHSTLAFYLIDYGRILVLQKFLKQNLPDMLSLGESFWQSSEQNVLIFMADVDQTSITNVLEGKSASPGEGLLEFIVTCSSKKQKCRQRKHSGKEKKHSLKGFTYEHSMFY